MKFNVLHEGSKTIYMSNSVPFVIGVAESHGTEPHIYYYSLYIMIPTKDDYIVDMYRSNRTIFDESLWKLWGNRVNNKNYRMNYLDSMSSDYEIKKVFADLRKIYIWNKIKLSHRILINHIKNIWRWQ